MPLRSDRAPAGKAVLIGTVCAAALLALYAWARSAANGWEIALAVVAAVNAGLVVGLVVQRRSSPPRSLWMAQVLDAVEDGIAVFDRDAALVHFNPAAARMFAVNEVEEAPDGHAGLEGLFDAWRMQTSKESCPIRKTIRSGVVHQFRCAQLVRANGETFPADLVVSPVRARNTIVGAVLTFRDVSDQAVAAEELRRNRTELERRVADRTEELAQRNRDLVATRDELEHRVAVRTGDLVLINEMLQDEVRERSHTEDQLRRERDKAQSYLDLAGTIFLALDDHGCVTMINRAGSELLGYPEQEILGKNWLEHFLPPAARRRIEPDICRTVMGERDLPKRLENAVLTRSGESRIVQWQNAELLDDGHIVGILSSGLDVTEQWRATEELRESEERYRNVVDNVGIGVSLIDPHMRILSLNRQMREWNPSVNVAAHPLCYRAFNDPPRDTVCSYCPTRLTLRDGLVHEATTETPAGDSTRNYRIVATPIRNGSGDIVAAIEMVEDVTLRTLAEREQRQHAEALARSKGETEDALARLKLAQASMVHSEKMASIGVLAAGIAHEINNPIGFVSSNLRELIHYADKIQSYLKEVGELEANVVSGDLAAAGEIQKKMNGLRKSLKLDFILNDLSDVVRESLEGTASVEATVQALKVYARRDEVAMSTLSVQDCIDNSLRVVGNQIKFKLDVIKDYAPVPDIVAHSGALQQVFTNLLVNAAQAVEGHGAVTLQVRGVGSRVIVRITDTGSGIAPGHVARIFEPFFTTKDVGQGTGLGLSIVYDIVTKHRGTISVESEPGKGTCFTLGFPAALGSLPHGDMK